MDELIYLVSFYYTTDDIGQQIQQTGIGLCCFHDDIDDMAKYGLQIERAADRLADAMEHIDFPRFLPQGLF